MAKHVDHHQRRDELAAAVWRLVVREGVEAASLRRVAAEAGWSVGSVRHYFATQHELLVFAMELVVTRATARLQATPPGADARTTAAALLHQLLPLDDERRAEMQVWLAFSTRAAVDPALRPLRDEAHAGIAQLCRELAATLGAADPDLTGGELHALADGLALQGVLTPHALPPARIEAILAGRLEELATS